MHRIGSLIVLVFGLAAQSSAGTIITDYLNVGPGQSNVQISSLALQDLGFDPSGFFFFTGNTAYDYNGVYDVAIIAAPIDPESATSLDGVTIQEAMFIINNSPNDVSGTPTSNTPEPGGFRLALIGLAWVASRFHRAAYASARG